MTDAELRELGLWKLSELYAIRDRTPEARCDVFSNSNGIQSFRMISTETGRARTWTRVDPSHDGMKAGFIELTSQR